MAALVVEVWERDNMILRTLAENQQRAIDDLQEQLRRATESIHALTSDFNRINAENDRLREFQHISSTRLIRDWSEKWSPFLQRIQNESLAHSKKKEATSAPFHQCDIRQQNRMMSAARNFLQAVSNDDVKGLVTSLLESDQFLSMLRTLCPYCLILFWILLLSLIFLHIFIQNRSR